MANADKIKNTDKPSKILIVDDQNFIRMILKKILEPAGYELIEAEDGSEGISRYKEHRPDIVLLDIVMPDTDGIECLKQIMEFDANAKVVMCSSVSQMAIEKKTTQLGAYDFIVKPFESDRVMEAVSKSLSGGS